MRVVLMFTLFNSYPLIISYQLIPFRCTSILFACIDQRIEPRGRHCELLLLLSLLLLLLSLL